MLCQGSRGVQGYPGEPGLVGKPGGSVRLLPVLFYITAWLSVFKLSSCKMTK